MCFCLYHFDKAPHGAYYFFRSELRHVAVICPFNPPVEIRANNRKNSVMSNGNYDSGHMAGSAGVETGTGEPKAEETLLGHEPRFRVTKRRGDQRPLTDRDAAILFRRWQAVGERMKEGTLSPKVVAEMLQNLFDGKILMTKSLLPSPEAQVNIAQMVNVAFGLNHPLMNLRNGASSPDDKDLKSLRPNQAYVLTPTFGELNVCLRKLWEVINSMHYGSYCDVDFENYTRFQHRPGYNVAGGVSWELIDFGDPDDDQSVQQLRNQQGPGRVLADVEVLWALIYNPQLMNDLSSLGFDDLWVGNAGSEDAVNVPYFGRAGFDAIGLRNGHSGSRATKRCIPGNIRGNIPF